jgi:hypothetical protein
MDRQRADGPKDWRCGAISAAAFIFWVGPRDGALAQQLGQGIDDNISVWRVVATLLVCLIVAVGAALVLKRRLAKGAAPFRLRRTGSRLEMIEILAVRPQVDLCLIACDGEEFLVISAPQGTRLLRHQPSRARPEPRADNGP